MSFYKDDLWYIKCDSECCSTEPRGPFRSDGEDPPEITLPGWTMWEATGNGAVYHFCPICHCAYLAIKTIKGEV